MAKQDFVAQAAPIDHDRFRWCVRNAGEVVCLRAVHKAQGQFPQRTEVGVLNFFELKQKQTTLFFTNHARAIPNIPSVSVLFGKIAVCS